MIAQLPLTLRLRNSLTKEALSSSTVDGMMRSSELAAAAAAAHT